MAHQGEPVFQLRAQDIFAPDVIEHWANKVEHAVSNTVSSDADKTRQKVKDARTIAHMMREWQAAHPTKIPD